MHTTRIKTGALVAVGLAGAMTAGTGLARAQSADKAKPTVSTSATVEGKVEARPGPLDVVVQFHGTAAQIDTNATASLDRTADWLREDPGHHITISVLPDESARLGANAALVQQRADAARVYLIGRGVAPGQIKIVTDARLPVGPADRQNRALFLVSVAGDAAVAATPATPPPADESLDLSVGEPFPAPPPDAPDFDRDDREPVVMKATADHSDDHLLTPFGMAITIGGGVVGFFDDDARELGNLGAAWEARLTLGTRTPVAFEAAYIGSAQSIDALGLGSDAVLVGTGFEGDLRVNFTTTYLQPYVFGGMGFTRYDLTNEDFNTSSVNGSERMGHIPFGAGLGFQYGGLLLDVRGTVRAAFSDDLVNEPATEDDPLDNTDTRTDLDTWSAAARLGWEF